MKYLLLLLTVYSLSACVKVSDAEPENQQAQETSMHSEYVVQALSEPSKYEVQLHVPDDASAVERINLANQSKVVLPFQFRDGFLIDSQALSDQEYLYQFGAISGGEFQVRHELRIKIPKDLVIQGVVNLNEDTNWTDSSRLFLMPGGTLVTNGHKLLIRTGKLFALGGVVATFADPETPSKLKDGGSIEIQADEGTGTFKIELLGKNGSKGEDGFVYQNGKDGGNGGSSGYGLLRLRRASEMKYEPLVKSGRAGAGGAPFCQNITLPNTCGTGGKPGRIGEQGYFCVENAGIRFCY